MGVRIREKVKGSGVWWIFLFHKGRRASELVGAKDVAEDAAKDITRQISKRRFDLDKWRAARAPEPKPVVEKPAVPTLATFYHETMVRLWSSSLAKSSLARYSTDFTNHILPALGNVRLDELTRDQCKDFVVGLCAKTAAKRMPTEKKQAEEEERMLAKDSIRNCVAALRACLTEAVDRGFLPANRASSLGKLYGQAGKRREEVDPFREQEIPLLLQTILTRYGHQNYTMALCLFHTGLRAGELAGLKWSDVDFRERFLLIRRQLQDGKESKTKTKKVRKVDISDVLLKELQILRKNRQEEYIGRGQTEIPELVFLSPGKILWEDGKPVGRAEGQPVDMINFRNRVFLKACDAAKIRRRRLHDTRHSFASILLMNGESPAYVKEQLGHSSIKMTVDVYGHLIPGSNSQAVNRLPSLTTIDMTSSVATAAAR